MMMRLTLLLVVTAVVCADPPEDDKLTWQPPAWPEWSERNVQIEYMPDDDVHRPEAVDSILVKNPPAFLVQFRYPVRSNNYCEALGNERRGLMIDAILEAPAAKQLSAAQRALVKNDAWRRWGRRASRASISGPYIRESMAWFGFYAATEADVSPMIEAVITAAETLAHAQWDKKCTKLHQRRARVRELQDSVARDKATLETCQATFEQQRRDTEYEDIDEARTAWRNLRQMARLARVDLAGIDAQQKALARVANRVNADSKEMQLSMDRLRLEQDIARAGALARQAQIESFMREVCGFIDAFEAEQAAIHQLQSNETVLQQATVWHDRSIKELRNPSSSIQPLDLESNPVRVQKTVFYEKP